MTNKSNKKGQREFELNQPLIIKYRLLLGIKGYYTNQEQLTDDEIIAHYKNLWRIEQAFRISKTDLKIRPIYHHKECTIKAHLVICFTALALSKYIEIKTQKSVKSVISTLKSSVSSVIINELTNKEIVLKPQNNHEVEKLSEKLICGTKMS